MANLRRTCLALLILGGLGPAALASLVPVAAAAPAVTFKATAIPIPGFPGTGNILGAGTDVEFQSTITGTEYGGFPSPLVLLTIDSPAGTKVDSGGFATCAQTVLETDGPQGCPKKSSAGPVGEGLGIVSFGNEQVREKVSIQGFFAPGNALLFFVDGTTPTSLEIIEKAHVVSGSPPFGPEAIVELPLVETVPGAFDASILSFKVTIGAAYKRGKKTVSYVTLTKNARRPASWSRQNSSSTAANVASAVVPGGTRADREHHPRPVQRRPQRLEAHREGRGCAAGAGDTGRERIVTVRVDVDGVGIEYEVTGDGPPVVLLHGFTSIACSSTSWRRRQTQAATCTTSPPT